MKSLTLIERAFLLKKVTIFASLELDHLLPIADKLSYSEVAAEEVIFDINEQAYSIYLIIKGSVVIDKVEEGPLYRLGEGELFGEEAALSGAPRAYRALSESKTEFLTLSRTNLFAIMREYPSVSISLLETFAATMPFRPR